MPTLDEMLPKLSKAKVFSTLDAKDSFNQGGSDGSSSLKTTFWTPFGRYKYPRLPFRINLAPELDGLSGVAVVCGDTLVTSYEENEAEANRNLCLNSSKTNLKQSEVKFMGHLITKDGLKPDPDKVRAVQRPTSKKELLSLLGFINYL